MAHDSITDLKKENTICTLPFDVVAVPQYDDSHSLNNTSPINVKIRIRNKEEIANKYGIISKFAAYNSGKKVRLVNSDQTIMSFDFFTEVDTSKKGQKKNIFHIFKRGSSKAKNSTIIENEENNMIQEKNPLRKELTFNSSTDATTKMPRLFMGKCKPGGCLDPPFNEDYYAFKPIEKRSSTQAIDILEGKFNTVHYDDQKIFEKTDKNIARNPINSDEGNYNVHSLITYPSTSSSSIEKRHKDSKAKSKSRMSSEDKARISVSEFSEIFFMPPKKEKNNKIKYERTEAAELKPIQDSFNSVHDINVLRTTLENNSFTTNDAFEITHKGIIITETPLESTISTDVISVLNEDTKRREHKTPDFETNNLKSIPIIKSPTKSKNDVINKEFKKVDKLSARNEIDDKYENKETEGKDSNFKTDIHQNITNPCQFLKESSPQSKGTEDKIRKKIADPLTIKDDPSKNIEPTEKYMQKSNKPIDTTIITMNSKKTKEFNISDEESQFVLKSEADDTSNSKINKDHCYDQLKLNNEKEHSLNISQKDVEINNTSALEVLINDKSESLLSMKQTSLKQITAEGSASYKLAKIKDDIASECIKTIKNYEVRMSQDSLKNHDTELAILNTKPDNVQYTPLKQISLKEPNKSEKINDYNITSEGMNTVESNKILTSKDLMHFRSLENQDTEITILSTKTNNVQHTSLGQISLKEHYESQKIMGDDIAFETVITVESDNISTFKELKQSQNLLEIPDNTNATLDNTVEYISVSSINNSKTHEKSFESDDGEENKNIIVSTKSDTLSSIKPQYFEVKKKNENEESYFKSNEKTQETNKFEDISKTSAESKIMPFQHGKSVSVDHFQLLTESNIKFQDKNESNSIFKRNIEETKSITTSNKSIEDTKYLNNVDYSHNIASTTSNSSFLLNSQKPDDSSIAQKPLSTFQNIKVDSNLDQLKVEKSLMSNIVQESFDNALPKNTLRTLSNNLKKYRLFDDSEINSKHLKDIEKNDENGEFTDSKLSEHKLTMQSSIKDLSEKHSYSSITIDFKFRSFTDEANNLIITTLDSTAPINDHHDRISVIKSLIRENDKIRIPINLDTNLFLEIKNIKENANLSESQRKKREDEYEISSQKEVILQDTLNSVYKSLIPLEGIIKGLKEEANLLSQQQTSFKNILSRMENKPMRLVKTNPWCGCNKGDV